MNNVWQTMLRGLDVLFGKKDEMVKSGAQDLYPSGTISEGWDYSNMPKNKGYQPKMVQQQGQIQGAASPQVDNYRQAGVNIPKAIQVYGGEDAPLMKYAPVIEEAVNQYPFLKDNPYLIPAIAHLETSSGRNVTRPNNFLNWGINYPGNNEAFSQMTEEEVLMRALSGIGERSDIYSQFRTGQPMTDDEIMQLGSTYEPANNSYPQNLLNAIRFMEQQVR